MLQKVERARDGIASEMPKIIEDLKKEILDLNRENQLSFGLNTEGEVIGRYSEATENITRQQVLKGERSTIKYAGDPYNFYDTGDFKAHFEIDFGAGQLDIFSTDSKAELLEEKYPNLYGFTQKNNQKFNYELIKPELLKFLKKVIHG